MAELDLGLNLYDMNKQAYSQEKPLDPLELNIATTKMVEAIMETKKPYWMLLCRERNDYTVFIPLTREGIVHALIESFNNRGQVLDIQKEDHNNYEIWIRDFATQENFCYYFFDYSFGVVQA